jgi:two-component system sensor histidine kinase KdpD
VGVLELAGTNPIAFDAAHLRFLAALGYYASLAVERMRLEAEASQTDALREADRFKTALLASVSHDLRTPLTTIKALAHDIGHADDRARVIEEEADRLNRMVADLLDMSRLQSGSVRSAIELNAVDDLIGAVAQGVSGFLRERQLQIDLQDGGTMLVGRFDLSASMRILVNLIENAAKYSTPPAPIELRASREAGWIIVTVADRGPGVPAEMHHQLFEPFVRAANVPSDVGGAGLGLAIARGLAEAQGGTLTYAARAGGGSIFTLRFPAADLPETLPTV